MQYVALPSTGSGDGDIFVELPAENEDRKNLIIKRGPTAFAMLNAFPYASGHMLIAPYRAVAEPGMLTDRELLEVQKLCVAAIAWLKESHKPHGFNVGMNVGRAAGAGIPNHVHWHVVPRWEGDTNFMGTVGQVRVMPQSLEDAFDRIKEAADREP